MANCAALFQQVRAACQLLAAPTMSLHAEQQTHTRHFEPDASTQGLPPSMRLLLEVIHSTCQIRMLCEVGTM